MLDVERERERERKRHLSWPACFRLSFRTSTIASPILPCSTTLVRARLAVLPSTFRLPASGLLSPPFNHSDARSVLPIRQTSSSPTFNRSYLLLAPLPASMSSPATPFTLGRPPTRSQMQQQNASPAGTPGPASRGSLPPVGGPGARPPNGMHLPMGRPPQGVNGCTST
jgi:hypothetical protein